MNNQNNSLQKKTWKPIRTDTAFVQWLDRTCPPFMVYALAGLKTKQTATEVAGSFKQAGAAGIAPRTLCRLRQKLSWSGVRICLAGALFEAAGIDPRDRRDIERLLKRTLRAKRPFPNLNDEQYRAFRRLCAKWKEAQQQAISSG